MSDRALTRNRNRAYKVEKEVMYAVENISEIIGSLSRLKNFDPRIASRRKLKESLMRKGGILVLASLVIIATKEMMTTNISKTPDTIGQLRNQINAEIENLPPNKNFTYNFSFMGPFYYRNLKSDLASTVGQIEHFITRSKATLPTYGEDRYASAVKNLIELNKKYNELINSKLTTDEQREKLVQTIIDMHIESEVKIIFDKNSSMQDIQQAQANYSQYVSLYCKNTFKNIAAASAGFFDALSQMPTPAAPAAKGAEKLFIAVDGKIAEQFAEQADNIIAKEIESSLAKVNTEYLNKITSEIDQGIYKISKKERLPTELVNISSLEQTITSNIRLIEGNAKTGFAHIVKGHYSPQTIMENGVVKEFTGATLADNVPGVKMYFPKELKSNDIVNLMVKAITMKNSKISCIDNKLTGRADRFVIESTFPQPIYGITNTTAVGYFNETTNTIDIISFYPTAGPLVRVVKPMKN